MSESITVESCLADEPDKYEQQRIERENGSSAARVQFVAMIKDENFYSDYSKWSLKQHWSGARGGFADEQLQKRWRDFEAGWKAAKGISMTETPILDERAVAWTKEFPSLKYGTWFWLRDGPSGTPELRQITGGRSWLEAFGMVSDATEFLGPVLPSDLERIQALQSQLEQLRTATAQMIETKCEEYRVAHDARLAILNALEKL